MKQQVTVNSVAVGTQIQKRDGGVYTGTSIQYTTSTGNVNSKAVHEKGLEMNPSLRSSLAELAKGPFPKVAVLEFQKNGQFNNLVAIHPEGTPTDSGEVSSGGGVKTSGGSTNSRGYTPKDTRGMRAAVALKSAAIFLQNNPTRTVADLLSVSDQLITYLEGKESGDSNS